MRSTSCRWLRRKQKAYPPCFSQKSRRREAVCIETNRILDSCRDRDCFEDVKVILTDFGSEIIEHTTNKNGQYLLFETGQETPGKSRRPLPSPGLRNLPEYS